MAKTLEVKCPAGQERHPVLSPNELDVECRIQGNLRPGKHRVTGEVAVCCDAYATCRIWMYHVEVTRGGNSTKKQRDEAVASNRARDVLPA